MGCSGCGELLGSAFLRRPWGALLVLLSALCFASLNILAQLAYRVGVPAGTLASARFLLAAAVFWPLALGLRRRLPRRRDAIVALAVGLVYSAASELLVESLTQTKAALVDLLFFTYPALVLAAASLSGREGWTARRAFSVCVSLVGSLLVLGGGLSGLHATGAAFALAAAGLYAVYVLLSSDLLARVDALVLVALVSTGAAAGTTSAGLALHQLRVPHGAEPVVLVAAVGFVSAVVGIGSFIAGVARLGPSRASIVSTAEPILTAALALLCFGDRLGPIQLGGGALVLSAIVVLERRPAPDTRGEALVRLRRADPDAHSRTRSSSESRNQATSPRSNASRLSTPNRFRAARSLSPTSRARSSRPRPSPETARRSATRSDPPNTSSSSSNFARDRSAEPTETASPSTFRGSQLPDPTRPEEDRMYVTRGYPIDLELRRAYRARRRPRRPILSALLQRLRPPSPASERAPRARQPQSAASRADPTDNRPEAPAGAWTPAPSGRLELRWQPTSNSTLHSRCA